MPLPEDVETVRGLLEGLSDREVARLCLEALRVWKRTSPREIEFAMHGSLGLHIVPLLCARKDETGDPLRLKEPFLYSLGEPWMQPVGEFIWSLVRSGLAFPLLHDQTGYPIRFRITRAGERLLAANDDHPLVPGFLDRAQARTPALNEAVVAHLADAQACLDHGLLRPAVVLIGLAYEAAVEKIADALIAAGTLPKSVSDLVAAKRLAQVRGQIDTLLSGPRRATAHAAYDFANTLRERRNDAAHTTPTFGFDDGAEIEELIISAARHLPGLHLVVPPSSAGSPPVP